MKFLTYMIPAFAVLASAGKVDECAGSCISKAISSTGCVSSDSNCICAADSFMKTISDCACGEDAAVTLAEDFCHGVSYAGELKARQFDGEYKGHPIERWFAEHPDYLVNHPGWLNKHSDWATEHSEFLKSNGYHWKPTPTPPTHPQPPHYPGKPTPPSYPHHPHYPGKPTPPSYPWPHKPTPTVW